MEEKEIVRQLKSLKNVQPNKEWAVFAKQDLLNHIELSDPVTQYSASNNIFKILPDYWKYAATGAFAVIALFAVGLTLQQPDILPKGQATISSDYVLSVQNRVNETKQVALANLDAQKAQEVYEKLDNIVMELEEADNTANLSEEPKDKEEVAQKAIEIEKEMVALTSIFSNSEKPAQGLRLSVEGQLAVCEDEKLAAEVSELLETDEWLDLMEAHRVVFQCQPEEEDVLDLEDVDSVDTPDISPVDVPEADTPEI